MNDIGGDFAAQPSDEDLDGVRIAVEILLIEMFDKLRTRNDPGLMVHEVRKQPEFEPSHLDRRSVKSHPRCARIEVEGAAFELGLGKAGTAAKERAHAGYYLLHLKGLGDIIVRTCVDTGDLLAPAVTRRKDEHRCFDVIPAPALQNAQAVYLGQAQIEDDGVVWLGLPKIRALLAIESRIGCVSRLGKRSNELTAQIPVVFYNQQAHTAKLHPIA